MSTLKVNNIETVTGSGSIAINNDFDRVLFYGELASSSTLTRVTETQLTGYTQNEIDTHSSFDGTTFTVPSGHAGKYFLSVQAFVDYDGIGDDGEVTYVAIKKNGSWVAGGALGHTSAGQIKLISQCASTLQDLSVGDAITYHVYSHATSGNATLSASSSGNYNFMIGYRIL